MSKAGGNSKKIGRGKRSPSAKLQSARTAANKARAIKKAAAPKTMKVPQVPRGTARAKRRANINRCA